MNPHSYFFFTRCPCAIPYPSVSIFSIRKGVLDCFVCSCLVGQSLSLDEHRTSCVSPPALSKKGRGENGVKRGGGKVQKKEYKKKKSNKRILKKKKKKNK